MYDTNKLYFGKIGVLEDFNTDFGSAKVSGNEVGIFTINHKKTVCRNINEQNKKYTVYKTPSSLIGCMIMEHKIGKKIVFDTMPLKDALKKYNINANLPDSIKEFSIYSLCIELQAAVGKKQKKECFTDMGDVYTK